MNVDQIATTALEKEPGDARENYLNEACGGDLDLHRRVVSLVNALEQTEDASFLNGDFLGNLSHPDDEQALANRTPETYAPWERFEIRARHAMGGLGEVCVAWDRQLRREVALKQIRPEWAADSDAAARFRREAEITGYLEHPGVVPIYSLGDQPDGRPFYAMQFIRGRTLQEVVTESLSPASQPAASEGRSHGWYDTETLRRVLDHFVDVCQTIDYAHSQRVIHRDLKPSNIMVGSYGQTLVVDWGLAKQLDQPDSDLACSTELESEKRLDSDSSVNETRQGTTLGTPRFMSPEQAAGKVTEIGEAADIYCLGATLYFALTGQPPHTGEDDLNSTLRKIIDGEFPLPREIQSNIPGPLQAIATKAMATDAEKRYPSAGDLATDLQRYLDDQPIEIFRDPVSQRLLRWTRNHSALAASIAMGVVLTFVGCVVGLMVSQQIQQREAEIAREQDDSRRKLEFEQESRILEAMAASDAALLRADAALQESRYDDAASLLGVAVDGMADLPGMNDRRSSLVQKRDRLRDLGAFVELREAGQDLDFLSRDTEAAILLQESLARLGVWDAKTWWAELPDQDLTAFQRNELQQHVYQVLTALNSIYLTKMVSAMGGGFDGGTPSVLKMFRSYVATNAGKNEARASLELTRRIESFRPSQAARWLGSIAAVRMQQGKRIDAEHLGPPLNAADGMQMAIFSLIASVDESYRTWFSGYGDTFLPQRDRDPSGRFLDVARESLRRVSDEATDDYWIRLTLGQTFYLYAQAAEREGNLEEAIEYFELSRSEYGRCLAIRPNAPFGHADRSTVALSQAVLMRDRAGASESERLRAQELLRRSLQDANQAKRLAPLEHWVHWHVGATAVELGQFKVARDAFFNAVELGFDVQGNLDAPMVRLDDHRGRDRAVQFAKEQVQNIDEHQCGPEESAERLSLLAALEYSRGSIDVALQSALSAIQTSPAKRVPHRIAGWCCLKKGALEQASKHFDTAIRLSGDDALSLLGAARIAEFESDSSSHKGFEPSDRWYKQAISNTKSNRHRAIAWIGIGKLALRQGDLEKAFSSIESARQFDPACDVAQFLDLGKTQARDLLRQSKSKSSGVTRESALQDIAELRAFLDRVAKLPIASIKQIVDSSQRSPPDSLPLLGGDFELPWEEHWELESVGGDIDSGDPRTVGASPPLSRVKEDAVPGSHRLQIKRSSPETASGRWRLSQELPATTGHRYELQLHARSLGQPDRAVSVAVLKEGIEIARIDLPGSDFETTRFEDTFELQQSNESWTKLTVEIETRDPASGTFFLDDLIIRRVE